jgi:two-component system chemotaxis sensor kinase CheA
MLRVDIGKVDAILNTIEEISLLKGSVKRIWAQVAEAYGHTPLLIDLFRISQNMERRIGELKQQVLGVRMVPIGQMFGRLAQAVRRYSRETDKKINLEIYGQDTEIDKHLADEAMEPLVHLVRNAIDHGLEPPEERAAAGKGPVGTVRLRAFQRGNNVVIEVEDDGMGIDLEKVRARAAEKGIVVGAEAGEDRELLDLIFSPGFSTKESVSKVSGRGVGLDVVKERLYSLGASVGVATEKGAGTTFTLTLPITLAIMKSLIVRVGAEIFAFPLSSIAETAAVEHGDLQSIEGRLVYSLRGRMVPAARLGDIVGISGGEGGRSFAVLAGAGDRTVGFLVDELLEQQDLVIKPLGEYFEGVRGFAGAAEIGRHNVIMVLDVESVIDEFFRKKGPVNV